MKLSRRSLIGRLGASALITTAARSIADASHDLSTVAGPGDVTQSGGPIRLSQNANPYGPSRRAVDAMRQALKLADRIPKEETEELRDKIARHHRVQPDQVLLGCGSGEVLRMVANAFTGSSRSLVVAAPTYAPIVEYAARAGAGIVEVPLTKNYSHDLDMMLAQCGSTTGLVYICNPNNPTGTLTRRVEIETFLEKVPPTIGVVIDEAYHHYVEQPSEYASSVDLAATSGQVIVTRSFSKIHALAGLRIGYAISTAQTASRLDFERLEENLSVVAIAAASAALDDVAHVEESARLNADDRQEFCNQANARMLRVIDSHANFVMVNSGRQVGRVIRHFHNHNIALVPPFPPFNKHLRISLGTPAAMKAFWRVWDLMPPITMIM
jgi:histidinol-phosphate aminotransferase